MAEINLYRPGNHWIDQERAAQVLRDAGRTMPGLHKAENGRKAAKWTPQWSSSHNRGMDAPQLSVNAGRTVPGLRSASPIDPTMVQPPTIEVILPQTRKKRAPWTHPTVNTLGRGHIPR